MARRPTRPRSSPRIARAQAERLFALALRHRVLGATTAALRRVLARFGATYRAQATERADATKKPRGSSAGANAARQMLLEFDRALPDRAQEHLVKEALKRTSAAQREQWHESLGADAKPRMARPEAKRLGREIARAAMAVDPMQDEPWLREWSASEAKANAALIRTLPQRVAAEVAQTVDAGAQEGMRWETLRDRLISLYTEGGDRYAVAEWNATRLARDQVGKWYADLDRRRQADLGVTQYVWRTALDERVRGPGGIYPKAKPSHRSREGQVFAWDDPPEGGHPGEAILCRCYAQAIVPGFEDLVDKVPREFGGRGSTPREVSRRRATALNVLASAASPTVPGPSRTRRPASTTPPRKTRAKAPAPAPTPGPAEPQLWRVNVTWERGRPTTFNLHAHSEAEARAIVDREIAKSRANATGYKIKAVTGGEVSRAEWEGLVSTPSPPAPPTQRSIYTEPETTPEAIRAIIGADVSVERLAAITGARDADVGVTVRGDSLMLTASADDYTLMYQLARDSQGVLTVFANSLNVNEGAQGQGVGTDLWLRMLDEADRVGAKRVELVAARSQNQNGYYTWARLGADGPLPADIAAKTGLATVAELMATPEGRAYWREHGDTLDMEFDPRPGSPHRRRLDAYLAERAKRQ